MPEVQPGHVIRPYGDGDAEDVIALVNSDRVKGQPAVDDEMLRDALAGRSEVDSGWWSELSDLATQVAVDPTGRVVGVISYAHRARDHAGVLLWLHGAEEPAAIGALLDHALATLAGRAPIEAFSFATALTVGLEALPVRHRPHTHAALVARGFVFEDLWRYLHRDLPAHGLGSTSYRTTPDGDTRKLQVTDGATMLAEATIGLPVHGIGVLWWIGVEPTARGQGLGRRLLGSALDLLAGLGAREAILYVDDDEPHGDRDRTAANHLYEAAGFTEIDRLYSYRLETSRR